MLKFKEQQLKKVPKKKEKSERNIGRKVGSEELEKERDIANKIKE